MQKVLVTGAAGFIGSTLSEALTRRGEHVVGLDNFQPFYDPAIKRANLQSLSTRSNFTFVEGDIRDAGLLNRMFAEQRFDSVIHLAAMAGVRPSIQDPMLYTDINLTGSMRLFEAMRAHGCTRMMFGSSSSVYGGSTEVPFRETLVADQPVSPYAATKRAGEVLAHAYHHLFGFTLACLRFFTVYGPRQRPEMAIHQFTRLIDQGKPIPFFGDGSSRRDYTYVDDIVDGVVCALDRAQGFKIYNLGGHKTTSLKELVEMIEQRIGKKAQLNRLPDQPGDVPITYADITRAHDDLGYEPKVGIEEGLTRFVAWYREHGTRELMAKSRVLLVVGARPNFMKAAPILRALESRAHVEPVLLHTGQHYDERMSDLFFRDLGMPKPAVNLEVGSGTHAHQTAEVMMRFEAALAREVAPPAAVVVVGDVNSTLACALVAAKAGILLAHVEAGLRSFDRSMPEELNRICTDQLADVCYVTEASGMEHLAREGKRADDCVLVGNTMIDTLLEHRVRARTHGDARRAEFGVDRGPYAVVTLHRPSNVDANGPLEEIVSALQSLATRLPILWPVHPRTLARAKEFDLYAGLEANARIQLVPPQGYLDFLGLVDQAALVLTDSGGVQEETTVLKVPCVTLRENTERPSTLAMGGNMLCGGSRQAILAAADRMLAIPKTSIGTPPLWDGAAATRIAQDLERRVLARAGGGGR